MRNFLFFIFLISLLQACTKEEKQTKPPAFALDGRMLCASNLAYGIQAAGPMNTLEPWTTGAGFSEPPLAVVAGPGGIHACLIGKNPDDIVIAFRGTLPPEKITMPILADWLNNVLLLPPSETNSLTGKIHEGFSSAAQSLWPQIEKTLQKMNATPETKIYFTGHSKGGAIAVLTAAMFMNVKKWKPQAVITFGAPRCGDQAFKESIQKLQLRRYENAGDLVPLLPPDFAFITVTAALPIIGEKLAKAKDWEFESAGELIYIQEDGKLASASLLLALKRGQDLFQILTKSDKGAVELLESHSCGCGSDYLKAVAPDIKCDGPLK